MSEKRILNDELKKYGNSDYYPFHMPGHKRNPYIMYGEFPVERDITEIEGFDNLHHPEDILKEIQEKASALYETKETFYSVNGSTAALLAAVSAVTRRNGKLLMARNCHKAVYHGAYLRNLNPVYVYPQMIKKFGINGGISPEDVDNFLKNDREIEAVLITSPTYDGIVSDVQKIAEICHQYNVPLIVDEAHGAHFKFLNYFPVSAVELGADLVIQSVHKTLPSLTQTAILHRCSDRVDRNKIQMFMGIYQSSSPSYLLMSSIDSCMEKISRDGKDMFGNYCKLLEQARNRLKKLKYLEILDEMVCRNSGVYDYDKSKILIFTNGVQIDGMVLDGKKLHEILLKEYHLEMEMDGENYVTALTSAGDQEEGFERLCKALEEIDNRCQFMSEETEQNNVIQEKETGTYVQMKQHMPLGMAMEAERERISLDESESCISAEFVYLYPPGIPILVPGEGISRQFVENVRRYKDMGLSLQGLSDYSNKTICVIKE